MSNFATDGNMIDDLAQFNLQQEIAASEKKKPWPSGIYAETLLKKHDFRVVLIAMEKAAKMKEHHADGTISVQGVKGHIRFHTKGQTHELQAGQVLTLRIDQARRGVFGRLRIPADICVAQQSGSAQDAAQRIWLLRQVRSDS